MQQQQTHPWYSVPTSGTPENDLRSDLGELLDRVLAQLEVDAAVIALQDERTGNHRYLAWRGFDPMTPVSAPAVPAEPEPGSDPRIGRNPPRARLRVLPGGLGSARTGNRGGLGRKPAGETGFAEDATTPLVIRGRERGFLRVSSYAPMPDDPKWRGQLENWGIHLGLLLSHLDGYDALERSNEELNVALDLVLETLARTVDAREHVREGHSLDVADRAVRLARVMGLDENELTQVRRGALLHDLGKLELGDSLLHKTGPLDEAEWAEMRAHPLMGYRMLSFIDLLRPALDIPRFHHERWDGTGYPFGLKGEEIPLAARIFAVVDAWEVLRSDRPYRGAWNDEHTAQYLHSEAGREYDPAIVRLFLAFQFPSPQSQSTLAPASRRDLQPS